MKIEIKHHDNMVFSYTRNIIDFAIIISALVFQVVSMGTDTRAVVIAIIGSICGAALLGYFRRERNKTETALKIITSTIGGIVAGGVMEAYFGITEMRFQLAVYFMSGLLSVAIIRAILSITEKNAAEWLQEFLQRVLGLRTKEERARELKIIDKEDK